jgi:hypothetical protein
MVTIARYLDYFYNIYLSLSLAAFRQGNSISTTSQFSHLAGYYRASQYSWGTTDIPSHIPNQHSPVRVITSQMAPAMISMPDPEVYLNQAMGKGQRGPSSRASVHSPPYPIHDYEANTEVFQQTAYIPVRQPAAEDFRRKANVYPVQSINECASDQEQQPVNKPNFPGQDSHPVPDTPVSAAESQTSDIPTLFEFATRPTSPCKESPHIHPEHKEADRTIDNSRPSLSPALTLHTPTLHGETTVLRVPTMGSDTFSPVLGGLHSISGITRKESKRERVKRCWRDMKRGLSFRGR